MLRTLQSISTPAASSTCFLTALCTDCSGLEGELPVDVHGVAVRMLEAQALAVLPRQAQRIAVRAELVRVPRAPPAVGRGLRTAGVRLLPATRGILVTAERWRNQSKGRSPVTH